MKSPSRKLQFLAVTCLVLFVALYIWSTGAARQKEVKLPKVVSSAKSIEVINVKVVEREKLVVTVRNNSEKPVVALTLLSRDGKDESGVTASGYQEDDEPDKILIGPHETFDMDMPLSYVRPNGQVRVGGVVYADDSEEGDKETLDFMRSNKKHIKSNHAKRGGGGSL